MGNDVAGGAGVARCEPGGDLVHRLADLPAHLCATSRVSRNPAFQQPPRVGDAAFAGVATFGLVVYGLAFLRLWDFWMLAFPLAFVSWSIPLRPRHVAGHERPVTLFTP